MPALARAALQLAPPRVARAAAHPSPPALARAAPQLAPPPEQPRPLRRSPEVLPRPVGSPSSPLHFDLTAPTTGSGRRWLGAHHDGASSSPLHLFGAAFAPASSPGLSARHPAILAAPRCCHAASR
ncbi:hypothetical protein PVAP13_3NG278682 [Panicum virgatum]|uniref:Uncharacterized protein n=1 Tax=Panicum virgatum TaxID=38727 RepID=A0A8T0UJI8_PANVG|nr:hypothetical protein PVAP13_3NG278682 [Panicum virgatum]